MSIISKLTSSQAPRAVLLIRLMVGGVFFLEGVQKFLYAEALGAGRFAKIGILAPELMGPFVGGVEVLCGLLVVLGLFTRLATLPLLLTISVAILSTKVPILLGHGFWTFTLTKLPRYGVLSMLHEARTDFSMLLGGLFLLIVGGGPWSLDARLGKRRGEPRNERKP
jgi:uncharacterized membrane protein YphA (DoxX/SURF4 family)